MRDLLATVVLCIGLACTALAHGQSVDVADESAVQATQETPAAATESLEDKIHRIKHPVDWLEWGLDLRLRTAYADNMITLNDRDPSHENHFQRYRGRWNVRITPADKIELDFRLVWEARTRCKPDTAEPIDRGEVLFDRLNAKFKEPLDLPVTVVVGRQDLWLGDGWFISEGTPRDGSRTMYFDAIRMTLRLDQVATEVELIYIDQDAEGEHWFRPIKPRYTDSKTGLEGKRYVTEQNERGVVVWVANKSIPETEIDGYFIYKKDSHLADRGNDADIYTFGGRVVREIDKNWAARAEAAYQFGHLNDSRLAAWGCNTRLSYRFNDEWSNQLHVDYEYRSGDRPGTDRSEAFDGLWGRYPRFSELYLYHNAGETRVGDAPNLHRASFVWQCTPADKLGFLGQYHLLFADQNSYRDRDMYSDSGCFRGQLITGRVTYEICPHVTWHLQGECFFPGNYYSDDNNDMALFARTQLMISF